MRIATLETLPVELLYKIQYYALSDVLPQTSRRLYTVFKDASPSVQATYLLLRHLHPTDPTVSPGQSSKSSSNILTHVLRYPICTQPVLTALLLSPLLPPLSQTAPDLPRRLFRSLTPKAPGGGEWKARHQPLPFLQYIYDNPHIPAPDPDAHDGYALTRAVLAGSLPLIRFLLSKGASPRRKNGLTVLIAIRRHDFSLVKLLMEPSPFDGTGAGTDRAAKRRRVMDRVEASPEMLRTAVKCKARDIAEWLMREKGCVPDIKTLGLMMK